MDPRNFENRSTPMVLRPRQHSIGYMGDTKIYASVKPLQRWAY